MSKDICITEKIVYSRPMPSNKSVVVRGRPPKAPEDRQVLRAIRLTPALWEKIDTYGLDWLRAVIKRAKPPKD